MAKVEKKTLRDVMPYELFNGEFDDTPAYKLGSEPVIAEFRPYKGGRDPAWPRRQQNVMFWVLLENGKAVGWNENPSRGWSFPVVAAKGVAGLEKYFSSENQRAANG